MTEVSTELIEAYLKTEFRVITAGGTCILKVDEPSDFLSMALKMHNATQSAFLTACNPRSQQLCEQANLGRMENLKSEVIGHWVRYEAMGVDPDGRWPSEPSFLIIGISAWDAYRLAQKYEQSAYLYSDYKCDEQAVPRLVFPREDSYYMRNNPLERMSRKIDADFAARGIKLIHRPPTDTKTLTATFVPRRKPTQDSD